MQSYSSFNNPVEDHYIATLDCGRSLAREAEEWMANSHQRRFEEQNESRRVRTLAFKKRGGQQ